VFNFAQTSYAILAMLSEPFWNAAPVRPANFRGQVRVDEERSKWMLRPSTSTMAYQAGSYDFREENGTWMVYDCRSGYAAALNGVRLVGLGLNEADDIAAVLNRVETQRAASRISSEGWNWPGVVAAA
jgi:hypothetical protein